VFECAKSELQAGLEAAQDELRSLRANNEVLQGEIQSLRANKPRKTGKAKCVPVYPAGTLCRMCGNCVTHMTIGQNEHRLCPKCIEIEYTKIATEHRPPKKSVCRDGQNRCRCVFWDLESATIFQCIKPSAKGKGKRKCEGCSDAKNSTNHYTLSNEPLPDATLLDVGGMPLNFQVSDTDSHASSAVGSHDIPSAAKQDLEQVPAQEQAEAPKQDLEQVPAQEQAKAPENASSARKRKLSEVDNKVDHEDS